MFGRELTISNKQSAIAKNTRIQSNNSPTPGNVAHCGRGKSLKCGVFRTRRYKKELAPQTAARARHCSQWMKVRSCFGSGLWMKLKSSSPKIETSLATSELTGGWHHLTLPPLSATSWSVLPSVIRQKTQKRLKFAALASTLLNSSNMCVAGCIVQSNSVRYEGCFNNWPRDTRTRLGCYRDSFWAKKPFWQEE